MKYTKPLSELVMFAPIHSMCYFSKRFLSSYDELHNFRSRGTSIGHFKFRSRHGLDITSLLEKKDPLHKKKKKKERSLATSALRTLTNSISL